MFDNLRRTLSAPAAVLSLLAGWMLPLPAALVWTGFVVMAIALPTLLPAIAALFPRHAKITTRSHLDVLWSDVVSAALQTALLVVFLAHHAWLMADAIGRTLFRLVVSHRRLLEWITAAQSKQSLRAGWPGLYGKMAGSVVVALVAAGVVWQVGPAAMPVAAPFVLAWLLAPAVAHWVSRPPRDAGSLRIKPAEAVSLRLIARQTWRFFETFVTEADNMLPPDNFQEAPSPIVAHRTSPTNLGLLLLSTAAAREFGWIGTAEAVERLEATLATMERMQKFRGHFFNWYDTSDLRALEPRYVSTVDSGNLAGHLIALANACGAWRTQGPAKPDGARGASDSLDLAREALTALSDDRRTHLVTRPELVRAFDGLAAALSESQVWLDPILPMAETAVDLARTLSSERADPESADMLFWIEAAHRTIASHHRDAARTSELTDDLDRRLRTVETSARAMAGAMEFDFLFDERRRLLSIGFLVAEDRLDVNCYDLLASEARLASFVAIASGDIPARHWFRLGREVTRPWSRGRGRCSST